MYFDGKFNFKAGLFSSTFWFEHSFGCHLALLVFRPYSSKNGSKTPLKTRFSKIGLKLNGLGAYSTSPNARANNAAADNAAAAT